MRGSGGGLTWRLEQSRRSVGRGVCAFMMRSIVGLSEVDARVSKNKYWKVVAGGLLMTWVFRDCT